jgi:lipopolysaccharide biosynthesis regulator YciM
MPTESTFLLAGLFFVAAGLGYVFARFGDSEEDEEFEASESEPMNPDYLKGLNYILNEQPDQALEVFVRMVGVDAETLETHFALGSLFRRRGEVDRAIRIHQNLIARPNLSAMHRDQAFFALAEDYLSAGLLDRAEKILMQLRESSDYRVTALQKLLRVLEVTQDWEQALEIGDELARVDPKALAVGQLAHYQCEVAEQFLADGHLTEAKEALVKADAQKEKTVRADVVRGEIAQAGGDVNEALRYFRDVMLREASLIAEILPRYWQLCQESEDQLAFSDMLGALSRQYADAGKSVALVMIRDDAIADDAALGHLREYVIASPTLSKLVDVEQLRHGDGSAQKEALERIRHGLHAVAGNSARYRCGNCGYDTNALLWQCPGCRNWESVKPVEDVNFASMLG